MFRTLLGKLMLVTVPAAIAGSLALAWMILAGARPVLVAGAAGETLRSCERALARVEQGLAVRREALDRLASRDAVRLCLEALLEGSPEVPEAFDGARQAARDLLAEKSLDAISVRLLDPEGWPAIILSGDDAAAGSLSGDDPGGRKTWSSDRSGALYSLPGPNGIPSTLGIAVPIGASAAGDGTASGWIAADFAWEPIEILIEGVASERTSWAKSWAVLLDSSGRVIAGDSILVPGFPLVQLLDRAAGLDGAGRMEALPGGSFLVLRSAAPAGIAGDLGLRTAGFAREEGILGIAGRQAGTIMALAFLGGIAISLVLAVAGWLVLRPARALAVAARLRSIVTQERRLEAKAMEMELNTAELVQRTLFPKSDLAIPGFSACGHFNSASRTCGDWYGYIRDERLNRAVVMIGDVMGHGIPAALVASAANSFIRTIDQLQSMFVDMEILIRQIQREIEKTGAIHLEPPACDPLDPDRLLRTLNTNILGTIQRTLDMTFFAGTYDLGQRILSYANAGHEPPLVYRAKGSVRVQPGARPRKVEYLQAGGMRIGDRPDPSFQVSRIQLGLGDVVLYYTDGVTSCRNRAGEEFGDRKLFQLLDCCGGAPAEEIRSRIIAAIEEFRSGAPLGDDLSFVVTKCL